MGDRRPFPQFGIRTMLWLTAAVAAGCGIVATPDPVAVSLVAFLVVAMPIFLVVMVAMGGDDEQAFSLGAVIPAGVFLVLSLPFYTLIVAARVANLPSESDYFQAVDPVCRWYAGIDLAASMAFGTAAVVLRRMWEARRRDRRRSETESRNG